MSEKSAVYECVDREHDAWRCRREFLLRPRGRNGLVYQQ